MQGLGSHFRNLSSKVQSAIHNNQIVSHFLPSMFHSFKFHVPFFMASPSFISIFSFFILPPEEVSKLWKNEGKNEKRRRRERRKGSENYESEALEHRSITLDHYCIRNLSQDLIVWQGKVTMRSIYVIFCAAILPAICLGHDLTSAIKAGEHSIASVEPILSGKTDYHDLKHS